MSAGSESPELVHSETRHNSPVQEVMEKELKSADVEKPRDDRRLVLTIAFKYPSKTSISAKKPYVKKYVVDGEVVVDKKTKKDKENYKKTHEHNKKENNNKKIELDVETVTEEIEVVVHQYPIPPLFGRALANNNTKSDL